MDLAEYKISISSGLFPNSTNMSFLYGSTGPPESFHINDLSSSPTFSKNDYNDSMSLNKSQHDGQNEWFNTLLMILKASAMILIMVAAVCGNLLVIISVIRNRRLR